MWTVTVPAPDNIHGTFMYKQLCIFYVYVVRAGSLDMIEFARFFEVLMLRDDKQRTAFATRMSDAPLG